MDYLEILKGYINVFAEFLKTYEYWRQTMFFVSGIAFGYLLRIIIVKLRIRRSSKKTVERNMVVIETRNRRAKMKKSKNAHYLECIENAQWQKTESKDMGVNRIN